LAGDDRHLRKVDERIRGHDHLVAVFACGDLDRVYEDGCGKVANKMADEGFGCEDVAIFEEGEDTAKSEETVCVRRCSPL
jgi:hypothetical protein